MDQDRVVRKLRRLPFTLVMLSLLVALGIYGQTHVGPLAADVHQGVSYSPKLLLEEGQVHRLITSVFFTVGGWAFYVSLAMLAATVGWTEWFYGTIRTMLVFWSVHLSTLLLISLVISWPLSAWGSLHGHLLYSIRDVGPSAGYYGCLGYAIGRSSRVGLCMTVGLAVLAMRLAMSASQLPEAGPHFTADLAHFLAILIGCASGLMKWWR